MRFILLPAFLDFHLLVSFKYHVVGTSNRFDVQEIYLEINRSMTDTISLLISGSESNECPFPAKSIGQLVHYILPAAGTFLM